jgi:NAD-dependent DNA ligase
MQASPIAEACGKLLQKMLMASYAYYQLHKSVMPDEEYDNICKLLLKYWEEFDHIHKHLLTKEDLEAGTLYAIPEWEYPLRVKFGAEKWLSAQSQ